MLVVLAGAQAFLCNAPAGHHFVWSRQVPAKMRVGPPWARRSLRQDGGAAVFEEEKPEAPTASPAAEGASPAANVIDTSVMKGVVVPTNSVSPAAEGASPAAEAASPAAEGASPAANGIDTSVMQGVVVPTKKPKTINKPAPTGLFAPLVVGAAAVMGRQELNEMRAKVIGQHTKVISAFVDTSESQFGQLVLGRMFEYADKDGNGTLDKEEVRAALHDLGFDFLAEKQVSGIMGRADVDGNEVIDFEEFVKDAPKTLRTNLVKLAKKNGHDLGFLA